MAYKRILLKLSGEALMGDDDYGINPTVIERVVSEIAEVTRLDVEVAIVIGDFESSLPASIAACRRPTLTAV